jgi:hypothetical protein
MRLLGTDQVLQRIGKPDSFDWDGYVSDDLRDPARTQHQPDMDAPENMSLIFPSSLSGQQTTECNSLRDRELLLRQCKGTPLTSSETTSDEPLPLSFLFHFHEPYQSYFRGPLS